MRNSRTPADCQQALKAKILPACLAAGLVGTAAVGFSAYFARQIVVPPKRAHEPLKVLGYREADEGHPARVVLPANPATLAPGRYGLYFDDGTSFARLGRVLAHDFARKTVTREVEHASQGNLGTAQRARISGIIARSPQEAGYCAQGVFLDLPGGEAPAWLVHPGARGSQQPGTPSTTWGIMIHGMGSVRAETLRALEATQTLGMSTLHISYRNDPEMHPSEDGRYGLGFREWEDVEVAIDYALTHGADDVVLFGWSMGGSIALQTADLAANKEAIRALVLDGPATDWLDLIAYHARINRVPALLGRLGASMISRKHLNLFAGLHKPISLERLSWLRRDADIRVKTLILHSLDDTFVPADPSQELARRSPLVNFVPFAEATHTREWNVDPELWTRTVVEWLGRNLPGLAN